jgi:hypothetical protein
MSDKIVHAVCVATLLWSGWAAAQGFSSTADSASPAAPKTSRNVNDAARALLSAQRDGTYAGEAGSVARLNRPAQRRAADDLRHATLTFAPDDSDTRDHPP